MKLPLAVLCSALLGTVSAHAALHITEVMAASGHAGGAGNGDWFEIYNSGPTAIDLTGWSWDDNTFTPGAHTFGSISIAPNSVVLVVDENAALINFWKNDVWSIGTPGVVLVNTEVGGFSGLGSGGDSVAIYNSGGTLETSVTFGAASTGSSFAWDLSGVSLGFSIAGTNGAYVAPKDGNDNAADTDPSLYAAGSDVASPGVAVPEPSSAAFLLLGLTAATLRRRRR